MNNYQHYIELLPVRRIIKKETINQWKVQLFSLAKLSLIRKKKQIQPIICTYVEFGASLVVQLVKSLLAIQGTLVQILAWEDPLEKGLGYPLQCSWASLVAQAVKKLPALWETWVWSPGGEGLLKEGMATHSSILTWRIWEEPGGIAKSQTQPSD